MGIVDPKGRRIASTDPNQGVRCDNAKCPRPATTSFYFAAKRMGRFALQTRACDHHADAAVDKLCKTVKDELASLREHEPIAELPEL